MFVVMVALAPCLLIQNGNVYPADELPRKQNSKIGRGLT